MESAIPSRTYFVLTVLSTIIAAFGLVSNSAATVIGAMIVAPLMGPILGVALSLVTSHVQGLRRSLTAEVLGVIGCFLTAFLIAWIIGPANIDYGQSEIAGRTSPTLYDMAIGFAAGLAGAYATVRPRISASIAGVAIAVALVPPVAVTGLAAMGALQGLVPWQVAMNSFLLFLANFVTIELAAALVFWWLAEGHHVELGRRVLTRGLLASLVLFALVAVFLTQQLFSLMAQRRLRGEIRRVAQQELARIPHAGLSNLHLDYGTVPTTVRLVLRARDPVPGEVVARIHRDIEGLAGPVILSVATITYSDYSSPGTLDAPAHGQETPDQAKLRIIEVALVKVLKERPRVDLISFRRMEAPEGTLRLFVSLRTPKIYDAEYVATLQEHLLTAIKSLGETSWSRLELTVRSSPIQDFMADGPVDRPSDAERSTRNLALERDMQTLKEAADAFLIPLKAQVVLVDLETAPGEDNPELQVRLTVRSRAYLKPDQVGACSLRLAAALGRPVSLQVENLLGVVVDAHAEAPAPVPTLVPGVAPSGSPSPDPGTRLSPSPSAFPRRIPGMSPSGMPRPAASRVPAHSPDRP